MCARHLVLARRLVRFPFGVASRTFLRQCFCALQDRSCPNGTFEQTGRANEGFTKKRCCGHICVEKAFHHVYCMSRHAAITTTEKGVICYAVTFRFLNGTARTIFCPFLRPKPRFLPAMLIILSTNISKTPVFVLINFVQGVL